MNALRQTNTFAGGMNMDLDYSLYKENQYNYAENIRIICNDSSSLGVMQNTEGFKKCDLNIFIPSTDKIIHTNVIRDYGIAFTRNGSNYSIYRFDFSLSKDNPIVSKILTLPLDIHTPVSSVCRWENYNNVKIYWVDGFNQTRVLNVDPTHDTSNASLSIEDLDIIPSSSLAPLSLTGFGSGSLKSGKIQYCYQLFNARGSETSLSPLSGIIHLARTDNNGNSQDIKGSPLEENTGKSVQLTATVDSSNFTRARVISIYYKSNKEIPVISVVADVKLSGNTIRFEDTGSNVISELTVDELNALTGYLFKSKVLAVKDNMLFAANITEDTWDIPEDYDTRAYRCNDNREVKLLSSSGEVLTFNYDNISTTDVPKEHDCICPYNLNAGDKYMYKTNSNGVLKLGGTGKNIEYDFILSDLIEDSSQVQVAGKVNEDFSLRSSSVNTSKLPLYTIENGIQTGVGSWIVPSNTNFVPNYGSPYVDYFLTSYMRDEIYRFGIVFYNEKGIPSPVHWIADIRMPSGNDIGYEIFDPNYKVEYDGVEYSKRSLVTHPLGIRFILKNVPQGVTGYEIVRCDRTISDRTILTQGIISQVVNYGDNTNMLLPFPYLSYCKQHGYTSQNSKYGYQFNVSNYVSNNYFMFVSPDICINRENSQEIIDKFDTIESICELESNVDSVIGTESLSKCLCNAATIKANSRDFTNINTLDYNKNNGFVSTQGIIRIDAGDYYTATLAKYYNYTSRSRQAATIQSAKLASSLNPIISTWDDFKTNGVSIGDKMYYNWCEQISETKSNSDANNVVKLGPHGICVIFQSNNITINIPEIGLSRPTKANSVVLCNIRQNISPYGGNSYTSRTNSIYISTGRYNNVVGVSRSDTFVFGGDTYIGVFDYANLSFFYLQDNWEYTGDANKDGRTRRSYNGAYIPCECSVNLSLRTDSYQVSKTYNAGNGYANHFVENDIFQIGDLYSQSEPLYAYNSAYSAQPTAKLFVASSLYDISNRTSDSRILNSEPKTNDEVTDSWTKFRVANYIDVDDRYGSINNMMVFGNKLYFWQTDAFGAVAVNERSLITDNNPGALTLGTGGILVRYDYFSNKNGIKENQLRAATYTDSTIYWYDDDRNEICAFNGGLQTLSKLKGVQSYLNSPAITFNQDPVVTYDKKYNEVLFTIDYDKTLVFNEQVGAFTSFYTYTPEHYFEFTDNLFILKGSSVYRYNAGEELNLYDNVSKVSSIMFTINKDYPQTKTFDNVEYGGDFTHGTNFNEIYFETKRQTSYTTTDKGIDYREDTYKFAIPRNNLELNSIEQLANKSYKDRMKGKYLLCHYKYDCNNGNTFKVPYISTAFRYSFI